MPKITAIIHTLNEEKNIEACLKCLNWVDDIIVVDMYSDDKTIHIAKKYTQNVHYFERVGFVEPAREFALSLVKSGWIIIVDADERVPLSLSVKLKKIAEEDKYQIVNIPFKNHIFGKFINYTGWFPDYHPRFFKKGHVTTSNEVHGKFKLDGDIYKLEPIDGNCVYHFGYQGISNYIRKINQYTDAEVLKFIKQNKEFKISKMIKSGFFEFRRRYFSKKGYKDGIQGLFISLLRGFYNMIIYMKYWEYITFKDKSISDHYKEIEEKIIAEYNAK